MVTAGLYSWSGLQAQGNGAGYVHCTVLTAGQAALTTGEEVAYYGQDLGSDFNQPPEEVVSSDSGSESGSGSASGARLLQETNASDVVPPTTSENEDETLEEKKEHEASYAYTLKAKTVYDNVQVVSLK